ncbi:MAG: PEGA domain-containing protein [Myxococcales bacterium]|nr:PEGA domain-containing protein [Myxococcales bacterium]
MALLVGLGLAMPRPSPAAALAEPTGDAERELGILPLVITGPVAPEVGDAAERLGARVQEVFPAAARLPSAGEGSAIPCGDAPCWQGLAHEHGVARLLAVEVAFEDPDVRVTVRLVEGDSGEERGRASELCELCGLVELESLVGELAAAMRRELETGTVVPPRLVVRSSPAGATVQLDGEVVGTTPLTMETVSGEHRVEIVRDGFVTERREVSLVEGVERAIDASLRPRPSTDGGTPPRATLPLVLGGTGIGLGLGVAGAGVALVVVHDRPILSDCSGENVDALGRCRFLRDTRAGGIALLVAGGVLVAGGAVALALGTKRRRSSRLALGPGGTLALRF